MTKNGVFSAISSMGSFTPIVTISEFSRLSGMSEPAVRKSVQRGYLPVLRIGRGKVMINLVKILADCLDVDLVACDSKSLSNSDLFNEDAEEFLFQLDRKYPDD
jgi:hypothetical protein